MSGELIAWASLAVYVVGIFIGLYVCGRVHETGGWGVEALRLTRAALARFTQEPA